MLTTSDKTRYYQLLGSLAPGNPVSHFLCGELSVVQHQLSYLPVLHYEFC